MRMRSVSSVLAVRTKRSAKQFALGYCGEIFTMSIPTLARTASNEVVNWLARSRTRNRKVANPFERDRAIDVEEVDGQHGRGLGAQEPSP
jgi:hypothetical protein